MHACMLSCVPVDAVTTDSAWSAPCLVAHGCALPKTDCCWWSQLGRLTLPSGCANRVMAWRLKTSPRALAMEKPTIRLPVLGPVLGVDSEGSLMRLKYPAHRTVILCMVAAGACGLRGECTTQCEVRKGCCRDYRGRHTQTEQQKHGISEQACSDHLGSCCSSIYGIQLTCCSG